MAGMRLCTVAGCPTLYHGKGSRCPDHARTYERERGTRQQRGYDTNHDRLRADWAPRVATGRIPCAKCGHRITPGTPWDLGHTEDRTGYTGPEHAHCNRSAGGRAAHQ